MKNSGIGLIFAALLAVAPAANADLKIGYVNAARVLDQSPQAAAVAKKLKQEFSGKESDLLADRKELKRLLRDYKDFAQAKEAQALLDQLQNK